jgi:hypothetical protein
MSAFTRVVDALWLAPQGDGFSETAIFKRFPSVTA